MRVYSGRRHYWVNCRGFLWPHQIALFRKPLLESPTALVGVVTRSLALQHVPRRAPIRTVAIMNWCRQLPAAAGSRHATRWVSDDPLLSKLGQLHALVLPIGAAVYVAILYFKIRGKTASRPIGSSSSSFACLPSPSDWKTVWVSATSRSSLCCETAFRFAFPRRIIYSTTGRGRDPMPFADGPDGRGQIRTRFPVCKVKRFRRALCVHLLNNFFFAAASSL